MTLTAAGAALQAAILEPFDEIGQALDVVAWERGSGDFTLDPAGRTSVYVSDDNCAIRVSAQG